ncbi:MAG TPA: BTAD domain-containing putative transcriptional regulator [Pseudonocardiaceae bacterium]|nr:BTAD domain-containing putative transcriptional regulator [Pseudonocardiaceae bacterium]
MDPPVDIRLLGPVEVIGPAGTVPLGPRLRTVAAVLALRAPEVVPRDALIEGIWDGRPPANADKTLRAHVAYLRRRLSAAGMPSVVSTRSPGYRLAAPAGCVDVHRFEQLVSRSRSAAVSGAVDTMASLLRNALGLWRGDVLAGCPAGEWVRAEATRLREVQLYASEELIAAELALGRHASVIGEIEALVGRNPLRERLWELLMTALHGAGRQGDALRAYRRARDRLVAELGVEPGTGLRKLEASILAGSAPPHVPVPAVAAHEAITASTCGAVPAPVTNLVGRRSDIAELTDLLGRRRLVTLTGVGGCGKTRLAIAVATEVAARHPDGVRFLDLSPVTDPRLIPALAAAALGVPEDPAGGPLAALVQCLRPLHCLLVLDNCEHLAGSCAELVATLLRSCPGLRVLATSRQTLGVLGEVAWPVPPLATPPVSPGAGLDQVGGYDAVRLFLDRAAVDAVRNLGDEDAPALAEVCAKLDGLPLAIELAAARTSVLTVAEIAARLNDPTLLHADGPTGRPHHRTLDATVAWSYELLDGPARWRLRRLAVFTGGFTLPAAEAVWRGATDERPAVDVLADLVSKSLVVMERQPAGARYRLLRTIGRWAAERLAADEADERAARCRHAEYHLALAEEADSSLRGPDAGHWLDRLAAEHENLRAALAYCAGEPDRRLRLAVALVQYCRLRGRYSEGRQWLDEALATPGPALVQPRTVGRALVAAAGFALLVGEYGEARERAGRALLAQRRAGDEAATAGTLRLLASVARECGEYRRSLAHLDEALAVQCAGGGPTVADVLQLAGFTCWLAGDLDGARHALHAALRHYVRLGDQGSASFCRTHLAAVACYRGELERAGWLATQALDGFTELRFEEGIAWAFNVLGLVALRQGRLDDALAALRASLKVHCALGDRWRQASVLDALAEVLLGADVVLAAELAGLATAIRERLTVPVPAQEHAAWARLHAELGRRLGDRARDAALARGGACRVTDVLDALADREHASLPPLPSGCRG